MDRLTELELFVQIAERGTIRRAAEALGISNPAASRHLDALENRVKTRLVERNTRRLYLTAEGREFYDRARSVLTDLHDAEAALQSHTLSPTGVLRVGASLSFSLHQIAPRLRRYHELYPNVRVHVETANRYLDMIDEGIDVAIRTREFESDSNVMIRRLATTRRVLCASPRYLGHRGIPKVPEDLEHHDFLLYVLARKAYEMQLTLDGETRVINVRGILESNDGQILRVAALDGMGIIAQPSYIVYDDIVAGRLVPVLSQWDLPRLQINIAYPNRKHLSAKVRSFIDFMADEFARHDYERKWTSFMGVVRD